MLGWSAIGRVRPNHMEAKNLIGLRVNHQLHEDRFVTPANGCAHRPEAGLVNVHLMLLSCFFFRQPDRSDLGLGEHGSRNETVVHRFGTAFEYGLNERGSLTDRHGREIDPVRHIANCVNVVYRRL